MIRLLFRARLTVLAASLAIASGVGCGPRGPATGSLTGTVTFNGQPITTGLVFLVNDETGSGATSELDASGKYFVPRVNVGDYKVAVRHPPPPGPDDPTPPRRLSSGSKQIKLPERFLDPNSSNLTVTIKEGTNSADFKL